MMFKHKYIMAFATILLLYCSNTQVFTAFAEDNGNADTWENLLKNGNIKTTQKQDYKIAYYVKTMPDDLTPLISPDVYKNLLTMYQNRAKRAKSTNSFGGLVTLEIMSNDYMKVLPTRASCLEIKLMSDSSTDSLDAIAVINTVYAPAKDSRINFYSALWKPMETKKCFKSKSIPSADDFYMPSDSAGISAKDWEKWLVPCILHYEFLNGSDTLMVSCHPEEYMSKEQYQKISSSLRKTPVLYVWNKTYFMKLSDENEDEDKN